MSSVDLEYDSPGEESPLSAGTPGLETWVLDHPTFGRLEAHVGWYEQLLRVDPGFPEPALLEDEPDEDGDDSLDEADGDDPEGSAEARIEADPGTPTAPAPEDPAAKVAEYRAKAEQTRQRIENRLGVERAERLRHWLIRNEQWKPRGIVITRDGMAIARLSTLKNAKMRLRTSMPAGGITKNIGTSSGDRLILEVAAGSRFVTNIYVKTGDEVVAFDPPPGSKGAARQAEMERSPWKRVAYPMVGGLSKAGWAIWVLVFGPLFGRLMEPIIEFIARLLAPIIQWILDHTPRFSIPWPEITWPSIDLPDIPWPDIHLPNIPWPHIDLPPWLTWLIEHPKTWMPIVIAIGLGVLAARNNKKSQATKAQWEAAKRERELTRMAGALQELERQRTNSG